MQNQASLYDQLLQVRALANKAGFYDAADYITLTLNRIEGNLEKYKCTLCHETTVDAANGYDTCDQCLKPRS